MLSENDVLYQFGNPKLWAKRQNIDLNILKIYSFISRGIESLPTYSDFI